MELETDFLIRYNVLTNYPRLLLYALKESLKKSLTEFLTEYLEKEQFVPDRQTEILTP